MKTSFWGAILNNSDVVFKFQTSKRYKNDYLGHKIYY